jgi:hypothetical protein
MAALANQLLQGCRTPLTWNNLLRRDRVRSLARDTTISSRMSLKHGDGDTKERFSPEVSGLAPLSHSFTTYARPQRHT